MLSDRSAGNVEQAAHGQCTAVEPSRWSGPRALPALRSVSIPVPPASALQADDMTCDFGLCVCANPDVDSLGQCTVCYRLHWASITDPELRHTAHEAVRQHRRECPHEQA
jgi:hypothetical protein